MSFIVDGAEWQFDGWQQEDVHSRLEAFLEFVEDSRLADQRVWIGDDFQTRPMLGDQNLWAIASRGGALGLPHETIQELSAWLGRAQLYPDEEDWPTHFDDTSICINGAPAVHNADAAWAHYSVREKKPLACLGLQRSGKIETITATGKADVFWIITESDRTAFWRDAIEIEGDTEQSLIQHAQRAYPALHFHDHVLDGLGGLAGGYLPLRNKIKQTFAVLNDYGAFAFQEAPVSNQNIQGRFHAHGLDIAPENPNVFLAAKSRSARSVEIGGLSLYCHWHVKLEPHRNRIHVHAPVDVVGQRVVVAIIHEHLPLP